MMLQWVTFIYVDIYERRETKIFEIFKIYIYERKPQFPTILIRVDRNYKEIIHCHCTSALWSAAGVFFKAFWR